VRKHDTIFFYSKTNRTAFHPKTEKKPDNIFYLSSFVSKKKPRKPEKTNGAYYCDETVDDVWSLREVFNLSYEYCGYPTQKPEALLEKIILASRNKGDIVLDPFAGSGTTLVVAQKLERKWIGIDVSATACRVTRKRLKKECNIDATIIGKKIDASYLKALEPFEFKNWVVKEKLCGKVVRKNQLGIDGFTPMVFDGTPIKAIPSENVAGSEVKGFKEAVKKIGKNKCYLVAHSFEKTARKEAMAAKQKERIEITLKTTRELLQEKSQKAQ
jgi:hypothetical protein